MRLLLLLPLPLLPLLPLLLLLLLLPLLSLLSLLLLLMLWSPPAWPPARLLCCRQGHRHGVHGRAVAARRWWRHPVPRCRVRGRRGAGAVTGIPHR